jgi:two-component system, sensor histidine kinase and response regulator
MDVDLGGARVLVMDDQEANLQLLERILRPLGVEVALLADPRRAAKRFIEFAPDIVLVDLHMPHLDGFEVLSLVRGLSSKDAFLPVVMLTADITPEAKRRALSLGVTDFLTKPLDVIEVALRVENLLRTRILHQQLRLRGESLEIAVAERTRQLELANRRMEELMRSKDEFVASVSHELRTPLSVVVGLAAELRDNPQGFPPEVATELIGMIADQSSEVSFIVEDLLVAARSEIDAVTVLVERVDIAASVDRVIRPMPNIDRERISASVERGLAAAGDVVRFRQVVRNLLVNACRHGGRAIEVTAAKEGSWLVLGVADDGPGLPETEWESIFDSYHSAHPVDGQPASVGLGLTVSRRLARLMGGDIQYGHNRYGSLFQFRLPLWPGDEPVTADVGLRATIT